MFSFSMNGRGCQAENRVLLRYRQPVAPRVTFGKKSPHVPSGDARHLPGRQPSAKGKHLSTFRKNGLTSGN
jgi:hypothetical protein